MILRPLLATQDDLDNELRLMKAVFKDATWTKDFAVSTIDYKLYDANGVLTGLVEVKNRSNLKFPMLLSKRKWLRAKALSASHGVPFILAIAYKDSVYKASFHPDCWPVLETRITGRTDRGDPYDIEPCAMIPIDLFERIQLERTPDVS